MYTLSVYKSIKFVVNVRPSGLGFSKSIKFRESSCIKPQVTGGDMFEEVTVGDQFLEVTSPGRIQPYHTYNTSK